MVLARGRRPGARRRGIGGALLLEHVDLGLQRVQVHGELADHGRELRHGGFGHGVGRGRWRGWRGVAGFGGGAGKGGVAVDEDHLEADTRL